MFKGFPDLTEAQLKEWIEQSLSTGENILASGYQGYTLKFENDHHKLVIKVPLGKGLIKLFNIRMLKHEFNAYEKLAGFEGVPECYGLVDNQYLVLQFIEGQPIRHLRPDNEEHFFKKLFLYIEKMHQRGVAHLDLKRKDNLLVVDGSTPCIIDLGASVIKKTGFHPFNKFSYRLAVKFDYNAWIKHKYHSRLGEISEEDEPYFNKTITEIVSRRIKRFYKDYIYDKRK